MSALSTIKADVEAFFKDLTTSAGKFCAAFTKLFGKAPAAIQVVENFIGEAAPLVTAAVGLADPVAEPLVAAALGTVETGLAGLQAAASAANSGGSFLADLEAFSASVPATLSSLDVKDPALASKVTSLVKLVTNEAKVLIPAVQAWVKQLTPAPAAAAGASA